MRILKILFLGTILSFATLEVSARVLTGAWLEGYVYLQDGRVLSGKIKPEWKQDKVLFLSNDGVQIYPAVLVKYLELYEKGSGSGRIYYSLPLTTDTNDQKLTFYEVLERGELTLLCRKTEVKKKGATPRGRTKVNRFYCLENDGSLRLLTPSKQNVLRIMSDHTEKVNGYIEVNHLSTRKKSDLEKVFAYYNSLTG